MINHYHGSPIWGNAGEVAKIAVTGAGSFISYARPDQIELSFKYADSVAIDNGAFSQWKRGLPIDWVKFYKWLERYYDREKLSFFCVPDVIDGTEYDNDRLVESIPTEFIDKAVPVWHMHESIERLVRLCRQFDKVAIGSSGEYSTVRSVKWKNRMNDALIEIYVNNLMSTKLHGLRMLDGRVLGNYPLDSADSTNLACNVPKYKIVQPKLTENVLNNGWDKREILNHRCAILKNAIEAVKPLTIQEWYKCL